LGIDWPFPLLIADNLNNDFLNFIKVFNTPSACGGVIDLNDNHPASIPLDQLY
jgi:hypothetical protein